MVCRIVGCDTGGKLRRGMCSRHYLRSHQGTLHQPRDIPQDHADGVDDLTLRRWKQTAGPDDRRRDVRILAAASWPWLERVYSMCHGCGFTVRRLYEDRWVHVGSGDARCFPDEGLKDTAAVAV
jgi:hypothetical protein